MRRGFLIVLALAAMAAPATARAGIPVDVTGFVGERTGPFPGTGQPLSGATVQLLDVSQGDALVDSDTTNASGNYTVTVPVGVFKLMASKMGHVTQCRQVSGNGAGFTAPPIELPTPAQAGSLNGVVTDSFTDAGIQGATVEISYEGGCDSLVSTQTGSNGAYVFPSHSLPGPVHQVTFSAPGYYARTESATVYADATILDAELEQVDVTPPRTKIKSVTVDGHRATVKFKANDPPPSSGGLNFACRLDHDPTDSCESPKTFSHLERGKHKVRVVAFDAAGNPDDTPASETFRIG